MESAPAAAERAGVLLAMDPDRVHGELAVRGRGHAGRVHDVPLRRHLGERRRVCPAGPADVGQHRVRHGLRRRRGELRRVVQPELRRLSEAPREGRRERLLESREERRAVVGDGVLHVDDEPRHRTSLDGGGRERPPGRRGEVPHGPRRVRHAGLRDRGPGGLDRLHVRGRPERHERAPVRRERRRHDLVYVRCER